MIKLREIFLYVWLVVTVCTLLNAAAHEALSTENFQAIPTRTNQQPSLLDSPTPTPIPTPVPLAGMAVASCPVSLPNLNESPDEYYIAADSGYGNPEQTMFIGLWPGGKVLFHPDGPGLVAADGSLDMKFWFYRTIPGDVVIEGRRLNEPGQTVQLALLRGSEDGYGETGFHPAGLHFASQGCWEVTATIGEARMTFVTLVVWIPFKPFWANWLPEGVIDTDTDLTGYPQVTQDVYRYPGGGELTVGTAQGVWNGALTYPDSAQQRLVVGGQEATCIQGNWTGEDWNPEADEGVLMWSDPELSYRVRQVGLGLSCQDLLRVASNPG